MNRHLVQLRFDPIGEALERSREKRRRDEAENPAQNSTDEDADERSERQAEESEIQLENFRAQEQGQKRTGKLHERSAENGEDQRDEKTQYFFEQ